MASLVRLVGLALLGMIAMAPVRVLAVSSEGPSEASLIVRAVLSDGRLWVLSNSGDISSLTLGASTWHQELLTEPAIDLCVHEGYPVAITTKRGSVPDWTLRRWVNGSWSAVTSLQRKGDRVLALDCAAHDVTVLTNQRLVEVEAGKQSAVALSETLSANSMSPGFVTSVYGTPDVLYVGINAGEWGGGLRRFDRHSGTVTKINRNVSGDLCGGPLNSACDPVNAIVADPWKTDCVVAAIGLVHFRPSGRVVEVCGDQVERLYYKPYGSQPPPNPAHKSDEPFSTVAFYGLTRTGTTLLVVGIDGVYELGSSGLLKFTPLPTFQTIGDVSVSFDLPNVILVLTNVNGLRSVSGSVPILVPR
jgi:hypothetical protein